MSAESSAIVLPGFRKVLLAFRACRTIFCQAALAPLPFCFFGHELPVIQRGFRGYNRESSRRSFLFVISSKTSNGYLAAAPRPPPRTNMNRNNTNTILVSGGVRLGSSRLRPLPRPRRVLFLVAEIGLGVISAPYM